jgi:hypothetical protein
VWQITCNNTDWHKTSAYWTTKNNHSPLTYIADVGKRIVAHKPEFREMVRTKLAPKIENLTLLNQELEKCLNSAKYLQLRGFAK